MRRLTREARRAMWAAAVLVAASACRHAVQPDAYGNFEATEVVVGSQTSGQLVWFGVDEGERIDSGALAAVVDTTQLVLERAQLSAQHAAGGARTREASRRIDALTAQREIASRTYERTRRLAAQRAATAQQLDQAEREYRVLDQQVRGAQADLEAAREDAGAGGARVAQIDDRIQRSRITAPLAGVVLATYARAGEVVQPGSPLFKLAALDSLTLRAYVTEPQLAGIPIGRSVTVSVDAGSGTRRRLPGRVSWVSSQAEFTPTPVQTRDERADLVYAIKIRVANAGGQLKIGMPADVELPPAGVP